jgi:hypothetical protein
VVYMQLEAINEAIRRRGLEPRGAFQVEAADEVPDTCRGPARTLVLAGNIGSSLWPVYSTSPEFRLKADGLDRWTRRVAGELAGELGAEALFPFGGPPHYPFQRWARRAESVHPSPLGILIHSKHGLWHAYRSALVFAERIKLPPRVDQPSPCSTCVDKPCLGSCPVGAFGHGHYDVAACVAHVRGPSGTVCRDAGCMARRACPVGRAVAYEPEQQRFHMAAFLESQP